MASALKEFEKLKIDLEELKQVTNNFRSKVIGIGGFGKVYEGEVTHSRGRSKVAIKRLNRNFGQGDPEFWREIMMLSRYTHKNLISLLGYCDDKNEKILVYQHASNGSLDRHLSSSALTWAKRLKICLDVASGLAYLHGHKGTQQRVIHRDIKSANILLDGNWNAKLSDMGLSKIVPANQAYTALFTNVAGTPGYCDPQYIVNYALTKESDIYSFGVVLFEVLCGRLCFSNTNNHFEILVPIWKKSYVNKKLDDIIFKDLRSPMDPTSLETYSYIAFQCLHDSSERRPTISFLVKHLRRALMFQERHDMKRANAIGTSQIRYADGLDVFPSKGKEIFTDMGNENWAELLLHGTLLVTIFEVHGYGGRNNIYHEVKPKREGRVGFGEATPKIYATIDLDKCRVGRTWLSEDHENPNWYRLFRIYCAHSASYVIVTVKDDNRIGGTLIGRGYVPVIDLLEGEEVDRWVKLFDEHKNPVKSGWKIHVRLHFFHVTEDRNWACGIKSSKYPGVPYTFFPQRHGCRVSLYQDAHVPDNFIPKIPLSDGEYYEPHRCWEDIFDAITNAKHFIYIIGWSVYNKIILIRDSRRPKSGGDITLGELLKKKSSEGVKVLMLVWDDRTSVGVSQKNGLMETHDEDTKNFFQDCEVECTLCTRNPDTGGSFLQDLQISAMFTHHQKSIVVDSPMPNGNSERRRVVSFVGGLDLCNGRYDTPFHSLFTKGGPRDPWHDVHSKLEGPIAWDVLFNFEQRWRKQGGKNVLVNLRELEDIIIPPSPVMFDDDPESWNVQLFRSIDSGAAFGFPETPDVAGNSGLVCGKDNVIDQSIQDAYMHAIRRAKSFIYIENHYFVGSSFGWQADDINVEDVGALHLIPKELSLKIVSKIEAGEKFTVYVVVPMWPEGIPERASVQAILDWQRRTMEMMYKDITEALQCQGLEDDPRDYLTFFCLGNREAKRSREYEPSETPEPGSHYHKSQEARRFMISVHAKMMIVDDEYIIVGSANINQRSMDGARDSEIAMGAYQPYHLATRTPARGQVHGFRMALWYEHLGMLDDSFLHPESTECVKKVNELADKYWDLFASENLETDLPGHLLRYPVGVSGEGVVTELPRTEFFPDTNARVLGTKSDYLPSILTT